MGSTYQVIKYTNCFFDTMKTVSWYKNINIFNSSRGFVCSITSLVSSAAGSAEAHDVSTSSQSVCAIPHDRVNQYEWLPDGFSLCFVSVLLA